MWATSPQEMKMIFELIPWYPRNSELWDLLHVFSTLVDSLAYAGLVHAAVSCGKQFFLFTVENFCCRIKMFLPLLLEKIFHCDVLFSVSSLSLNNCEMEKKKLVDAFCSLNSALSYMGKIFINDSSLTLTFDALTSRIFRLENCVFF